MKASIEIIELSNLALAFIPVLVVIFILFKWSQEYKTQVYAVFRMLVQLLLIGYILTFIFETKNYWIILTVLVVMLSASSLIALRTIKTRSLSLLLKAFIAITVGGGTTLLLITQGVLNLEPWFKPTYLIPLAGMIFANSMNSVSLAAERLEAELAREVEYQEARDIALKSSLIPITNSLFAVGLVSLPGMMTGQILSGIDPIIAARYQIMVMCMVFGSAGISSALFLELVKSEKIAEKHSK